MSAASLVAVNLAAFVAAEDDHHLDRTHHWFLPEAAEIIYGSIALGIVVLLFWKFGVHKLVAKAMRGRTEKVQQELDDSAAALSAAETEAAEIRQAAGDIDAERARILADADAQAEQLLADGRERLEAEIAELEVRADAEIAGAGARSGDELQGEIARLSGAAAEALVTSTIDEATHQRLIDDYIAEVGASTAGSSNS